MIQKTSPLSQHLLKVFSVEPFLRFVPPPVPRLPFRIDAVVVGGSRLT